MSYSEWQDYSKGHGSIPARSRLQQGQASVFWDASRRHSTPIRWHPEYGINTPYSHGHSPNTTLDTIHEDALTAMSSRHKPPAQYHDAPPIVKGEYSLFQGRHDSRRHSDGDVSSSGGTFQNRTPKRHSHGNVGSFETSTVDSRSNGNQNTTPSTSKPLRPRDKKAPTDARSDVSETHRSVTSVRSRGSGNSDYSKYRSNVVSRTPTKAHSRNDVNVSSIAGARRPSASSIANSEAWRYKRNHNNSSRNSATSRASRSPHSVTSSSSRLHRDTALTNKDEPVVLTSIEIPAELLDRQVSLFRRLFGPIVVILVVLSLVISLATAVYFAVVLKETQDNHIEFLEATLQFTIARNEGARDFSTLTELERQELKAAYCQQVDRFYSESSFQPDYRGCELNVLTNDRIEFKLFFLEPSGASKRADDIVQVLDSKAKTVGEEGSSLRQISAVTLNLDPASTTVDLTLTKRPEDFYGANSRSTDSADQSERSSGQDEDTQAVPPTHASTTTPRDVIATEATTIATTSTQTPSVDPQSVDETVLSLDICNSIRPEDVVAHPSDCGHYVQCEFGTPIARPCHGGLVFDPASSACVKPQPDLPCTEVRPCTNLNGGYFAHPTNCQLFIICDQNKTVLKSCPLNLVWDTQSQNCVPRKRGTKCEPV